MALSWISSGTPPITCRSLGHAPMGSESLRVHEYGTGQLGDTVKDKDDPFGIAAPATTRAIVDARTLDMVEGARVRQFGIKRVSGRDRPQINDSQETRPFGRDVNEKSQTCLPGNVAHMSAPSLERFRLRALLRESRLHGLRLTRTLAPGPKASTLPWH